MKCPYCQDEMEKGYLQSAREVSFMTHLHKFSFRPGEGEISLTEKNWTSPRCAAWCCRRCHKIIIDYHHIREE